MAMPLRMVATALHDPQRKHMAERTARSISKARISQTDGRQTAARGLDALPYLIFSSRFSRRGVHDFISPTGLVLLSISTDGDARLTALLRHKAAQLPQTAMVFAGVSGRTLKVVVGCRPADGAMPATADEYQTFLASAQEQAAAYYEAMLKCRITRHEVSLQRGCRMGFDPMAVYRPKAQPLTIVGTSGRELEKYRPAVTDTAGHTSEVVATPDTEQVQTDFYTCMQRAQETTIGDPAEALHAEAVLVQLARLCRKSAIPEEAAVSRTLLYRQYKVSEEVVRKIFHAAYTTLPQGRPWSQMTEKERIARKVKDFFDRRYELRYNTMKGIEEFRPRGIGHHAWQPLTQRDMRRIAQEQMMDSGAAWPIDIENYARSTLATDYNPVHAFLAGCGQWDRRHDYIGQMARRVPCQYAEWPRLFHRWFLGMVAGWLGRSRDFGNSVVPMLIGRQGVRKTTFCKLLLPHSLREYYIDDIKMDNAEQVERMLGRMALVNIDEYNAKTSREQAKIKRILTERDVQVRRMRSDQYTITQRMASFIATTNERQPLTDPTGSRRYLCVEVTGVIDTETPVNYQQLYAQAVWQLDHGEPYYMSREEELLLQQHNQSFVSMTSAEILLTSYYKPMPRAKEHFIRAADILNDLQQRIKGDDRPNMACLVKALKASHFEYGAIDGQRGWYAKKLE